MKYLLLLILTTATLTSCGKEKKEEGPKEQQCSAQYQEGIGLDGRYWFILEGHWVRCQGPIGISRPHCEWRR